MTIQDLKIYTSNLEKQVEFYTTCIGLELLEKTAFEAIFKIGKSTLILKKSTLFKPYHIAINIPSNTINEALNWLKLRVDILKDGNHEIHDFKNWNAKAIYFYDNDNNILELIARQNLNIESSDPFDSKSFLEISEIGLPVNNITETYKALDSIMPIKKYYGNFERFCALGDENGLFICINKNLKTWYPTNDIAYSSEFEINVSTKGKEYQLEFKHETIGIRK